MLQKRIMTELTNRITNYYDSIRNCRYMATTTFLLQTDLERQYKAEIMSVVDALRLKCALFRELSISDIQLEVRLDAKQPYAHGWCKATGAHKSRWTFEEYWILKDGKWYNKNLFPKLR